MTRVYIARFKSAGIESRLRGRLRDVLTSPGRLSVKPNARWGKTFRASRGGGLQALEGSIDFIGHSAPVPAP